MEPSSSGEQLEEEGGEEDQPEVLLGAHPGAQRHTRTGRPARPQRIRTESPEGLSKELSEFIAEEMNQMAEDSGESGITDMEESETTLSIRSAPLPQSIDSSEELSKLRPRIDPRLCPSPG